jgi:hypothetical protein
MKFLIRLFLALLLFYSVAGMFATMIMPGQEKNIRLLSVVCDGILLGMALLALWRERQFYGVWAFLVFVLSSVLTFLYTSDRFGFVEHLNGLRDSVCFFAALIVVHDIFQSDYKDYFVRRFTQFLIVFAILQIPVSIVQFIQYGAGDGVGGTYGTAGGSGYITQILFIICFFFAVRFGSLEDGTSFSLKRLPFLLFILLPCAINETKISFVLLFVFIILVAGSRKRLLRTLPLMILGGVLVLLFNYFYTSTVEDTRNLLDVDFIEKYLVTNQTETGGDLPRFQRLIYMFKMMGGDTGSILLGMGYGVMGGGNIMGVSRLGRALYYLVTGSRILLFRVWMQGGLIAVLSMGYAMFAWMRSKVPLYPTLSKFGWYLAFGILLVWVYNEAMLDRVFAIITSFMMIWTREGGNMAELEGEEEFDTEESTSDAES